MRSAKRLIDSMQLVTKMSKRIHAFILLGHTQQQIYDEVLQVIAEVPTVDAVEVVHGRWEPHPEVNGYERCSVCHDCIIYDDWVEEPKWYYCPNCGAKMDKEETK